MAVATIRSRFPQEFSSDFATSVNDAQNHNSVIGFHMFVNNDVRRNDTNAHARPKDGAPRAAVGKLRQSFIDPCEKRGVSGGDVVTGFVRQIL